MDNTNDDSLLVSLQGEIETLHDNDDSLGQKLDNLTEIIIDQKEEQSEQYIKDQEATSRSEAKSAETQADYYSEVETLLTDINDQIVINNGLVGGQYFGFGIISGILLFTILWNKIRT